MLKNQNVPFVLNALYFPDILSDYVVIDNTKVSSSAIKRFVGAAHEKIGMVTYSTYPAVYAR